MGLGVQRGAAMTDPQLEFHLQALQKAAGGHSWVADQIADIRDSLDDAHLPPLAFGLIGEVARLRYNRAHSADLTNLGQGAEAANGIGDNLQATWVEYGDTEDLNYEKAVDIPEWKDGNFFFGNGSAQFNSLGAISILGYTTSTIALLQNDAHVNDLAAARDYKFDLKEDYRRFDSTQGRRFPSVGYGGTEFKPEPLTKVEAQISRLSKLSKATEKIYMAGSRASIAAVAGAALWSAATVSSDEAIDNSITAGSETAKALREIFGSDTQAMHDELRKAWDGEAKGAADPHLRNFVTAGVELADQFENKADTLRELVEDLNLIHEAAFYAALAQVGAILACSLLPFAMPAKEILGLRLTANVVTTLGLIAGAIGAATWLTVEANGFSASPPDGIPQRTFGQV